MRGDVGKLERELRSLEAKRADLSAQLERAEAEAQTARGRRAEIEKLDGLVALGELDLRQADKTREEIENAIEAAAREARGNAAAIAELDRRIEAKQGELRVAKREEQTKRWRATLAERNKLETEFVSDLGAVDKKRERLEALREREVAERTELRPLLEVDDDGSELWPDAPEDEPVPFSAATFAELTAFLVAGHVRPSDLAEKGRQELERQHHETVKWAAGPGWSQIDAQPPGVREEAMALRSRNEAKERRRRDLERQAIANLGTRGQMTTAEAVAAEVKKLTRAAA